MKIPPIYTITPEILELISKIEANRIFLSSINIPLSLKDKIRRTNILKSALFSARIEGNTLNLREVEQGESEERQRVEIFNILRAYEFTDKNIKSGQTITKEIILNLHSKIMNNISGEKGVFRREMGAIFNQAGIAVCVAPPPEKIKYLIGELLSYVNSDLEKFPLLSAFVFHLVFEKIHPFVDGNGRLGRLLIFTILKIRDQNFNSGLPFEEYLDEHRNDYYYFLEKGLVEINDYLIFMLEAFYHATEKLKELVEKELAKKETVFLPPRQEEIYNIVKDHRLVSFDQIRRRFLKVPERTLRYDLKKLTDAKLIIKIGETKGSFYRISEEIHD
ncbi:Fic family protein [Candidatus Parcubacteria bacterium]|nr:MAG: Fic family protein [Candidatus Parcubacteria bacterium]